MKVSPLPEPGAVARRMNPACAFARFRSFEGLYELRARRPLPDFLCLATTLPGSGALMIEIASVQDRRGRACHLPGAFAIVAIARPSRS
jgi:hypothetical protein